MKKDVLITIKDEQTVDGERERMEITTRGSYEGNPEDYTLSFIEHFGDNAECNTRLNVRGRNLVTMIRSGAYNSELIIESRKRHSCHYNTPHGEFLIGIYAKNVSSSITEDGGSLKMNYTIDFYTGLAAENNMTINVEMFS